MIYRRYNIPDRRGYQINLITRTRTAQRTRLWAVSRLKKGDFMNKKLPLYKFIHAILFGAIYFVIESLYKGHWTDWRMFILSAVIGLIIGCLNELFSYDTDFVLQCFTGTLVALLCECIFGYQWNVIQGLALWDYANLPFSAVANQINLFFGVVWFVLSGICVILDDALHYYVWKHERPYYRIGQKRWYLPLRK